MDETILRAIQKIQGKAVLATIIRTEGSTPRGQGTQMLIMENGQTVGTIGGGIAERLICQRAPVFFTAGGRWQAEIQHVVINQENGSSRRSGSGSNSGSSRRSSSGSDSRSSSGGGLPACGNNLDVLLEPIEEKYFWQLALDLQTRGKEAVMITSLIPPYSRSIADSTGHILLGQSHANWTISAPKLQKICADRQAEVVNLNEEYGWLVEPILKTERLLILGAGHVAREVAYHAQTLDFQVTVIDDRADYAQPEFFPGAYAVICSDFSLGIKKYGPTCNTYIVIATWSHQKDAECLKEVLKFDANYVGMLGSTKKVAAIIKKLQEDGFAAQNIARLKAPIGLAIGAQTPSEIAISILAEIISVRRGT